MEGIAMKVAFDTNAIIDLCGGDDSTDRVIAQLNSTPGAEVFIVAEVAKQSDITRLIPAERANFDRLDVASSLNNQRYFTIGVSAIGGSDMIRGDTALTHGIQS
jgi:hypothetical protein